MTPSLSPRAPQDAPDLPRHVAIIMDGNGRWAKERGQVRWEGHSAGAKSVRSTVEAAGKLGIDFLTLYAFSVNNWKRPRLEVEALMRLLTHFARKEQAELIRQNVRVRVVGCMDELPRAPRQAMQQLLDATSECSGMTLSLALSYGARNDLLEATRRVASLCQQGKLKPSEITETTLRAFMSTAHLPDVDLLIRTGGESRISDFLLTECAYAELCFIDVMWPDFRRSHLEYAIDRYRGVERRFGLTSSQVERGLLADVS